MKKLAVARSQTQWLEPPVHKWYWMPQSHTWQPLRMRRQNSVRGQPENSLHQERTHAEQFTHSKCSEHLASRWKKKQLYTVHTVHRITVLLSKSNTSETQTQPSYYNKRWKSDLEQFLLQYTISLHGWNKSFRSKSQVAVYLDVV